MVMDLDVLENNLVSSIKNNIIHPNINIRKFRNFSKDSDWFSDNSKYSHIPYREHISAEHKIDVLIEQFEPIPASRKRAGMFRIAYVYPDSSIIDPKLMPNNAAECFNLSKYNNIHPLCVNCLEIKDDFPKELLQVSRNLLEKSRKSLTIFIAGERGVGKSAFLNQLYSINWYLFENYKVVYVRADLTKMGAQRHNLLGYLLDHTYDILISKYINGGDAPIEDDFFDINDYYNALQAHNKRREELNDELFFQWIEDNKIVGGYEFIHKRKIKFPYIDHHQKMNLAKLLIKFMKITANWSFIFVLDGLDDSTVKMIESDKLQEWHSEIIQLLDGHDWPKGLYIICARQESYRDFVDHLESSDIPRHFVEWIIYPSKLNDITYKRIELFKERILKNKKSDKVKDWTCESVDLLFNLTEYAIDHTLNELELPNDFLVKLAQTGHIRSILNFYRKAIDEVASIIYEEYSGRIGEIMMTEIANVKDQRPEFQKIIEEAIKNKCYRIWTLSSFSYSRINDKLYTYLAGSKKIRPSRKYYDFPLIPIIWGDIVLNEEPGYFNHVLLHKILILEYIMFMNNLVNVNTIINSMKQLYQLNPSHCIVVLKSMIMQRLLKFKSDENVLTHFKNSILQITPLGELIVRELIYFPSYIENTMQLSAIPIALSKNEFKKFLLVSSIKYDESIDKEIMTLKDYLPTLFKTYKNFLSLIDAYFEWFRTRKKIFQDNYHKRKLHDNDLTESEIDSLFEFSEKPLQFEKNMDDIRAILASNAETRVRGLFKIFRDQQSRNGAIRNSAIIIISLAKAFNYYPNIPENLKNMLNRIVIIHNKA